MSAVLAEVAQIIDREIESRKWYRDLEVASVDNDYAYFSGGVNALRELRRKVTGVMMESSFADC